MNTIETALSSVNVVSSVTVKIIEDLVTPDLESLTEGSNAVTSSAFAEGVDEAVKALTHEATDKDRNLILKEARAQGKRIARKVARIHAKAFVAEDLRGIHGRVDALISKYK